MSRIAFYTFGLLIAPYDDPAIAGFNDRTDPAFSQAKECDGFLMLHDGGEGTPRFADPAIDTVAHTLSLWRDLRSVYDFAYYGLHAEALRHRKEWVVKGDWPVYVAWWVPDDYNMTFLDAAERLEHLHDHGPSPYAFSFRTPFDEHGQPLLFDRRAHKEAAI